MSLVYVIEDDPTMADVIALCARSTVLFDEHGQQSHPNVRVFNDAVEPISEMNEKLPDVILLDVLLSGPDGFSFLNEMLSYHDTAKIPVVLITTLDLADRNLEHYGVVRILNKETMTPEDIRDAILTGLDKGTNNAGTGRPGATPSEGRELDNRANTLGSGLQKFNQQLRQISAQSSDVTPGTTTTQSHNPVSGIAATQPFDTVSSTQATLPPVVPPDKMTLPGTENDVV